MKEKEKNVKCKTEVYSRVTGFFRPVQDWNKGKKSEFKNRKTYTKGVEDGKGKEKICD